MGIIRIFEPPKEKCVREFGAHGCPLNHVQFHPKNPNLLLSASKVCTYIFYHLYCIPNFKFQSKYCIMEKIIKHINF